MRGLVLSVALALVTVWAALFVAFYSPYPIGFWFTTIAFGLYAVSYGATVVRGVLGARTPAIAAART